MREEARSGNERMLIASSVMFDDTTNSARSLNGLEISSSPVPGPQRTDSVGLRFGGGAARTGAATARGGDCSPASPLPQLDFIILRSRGFPLPFPFPRGAEGLAWRLILEKSPAS